MGANLGEAVLELKGDSKELKTTLNESRAQVTEMLGGLSAIANGAVVGVIGSVAALGAAAAAAMKIGLDETIKWGKELHELEEIFGLSSEKASQFSVAMQMKGVDVESGQGAFSAFIRNLENSRAMGQAAAATYAETVQDIANNHAAVIGQITDTWTTALEDHKEREDQIWQDLADRKTEIEQNLAEQITQINQDLEKQLASMKRDWLKQLQQFAKEEAGIEQDAKKDSSKVEKDRDKSLADVEKSRLKSLAALKKDYEKRMHSASTDEQALALQKEYEDSKKELEQEAEDRKKEIEDAAKERLAEIEERRKERQAELAEKKKEAAEEYAYRIQLAKDEAQARIEQSERAAGKQIAAAEKAAQKQSEALEKQLAKQEKLYQKQLEQEDRRNTQALERAKKALDKAEISNPIAKALKKLGVEAFDAEGRIRSFDELMPEIMEAFKKMPEGVDKSAIALQLFGRTGLEFMEFLNLGKDGLDQMGEMAKEFGIEADPDKVKEYGKQWKILGLAVEGLKLMIGNEVLPIVTELMKELVKWTREHLPQIRAGIKQFIDWVKANWPTIQKSIQDAWKKIEPIFKLIGSLLQGLLGDNKKVSDGFMAAWNIVKKAIDDAWKFIKPILEYIQRELSKFWTEVEPRLQKAWANIEKIIRETWDEIWRQLKPVIDAIVKYIQDHHEEIQRIIDNAMAYIKAVIGLAWSAIKGIVKVWLDLIGGDTRQAAADWQQMIDNVMAALKIIIGSAWEVIKGIVSLALQAIWQAISGKMWEIYNNITGTFNNIIAALGTLATNFWNKGIEIANALLGGIKLKLLGIGQAIVDAINTGIALASQTVTGLINAGKGIIDGLIAGMKANAGKMARALRDIIKDVLNAILSNFGLPLLPDDWLEWWFQQMGLAKGGWAQAGRPYIVGEMGPELFIPSVSGTVVPNNLVQNYQTRGDVNYNLTIQTSASVEPIQADFEMMRALAGV